MLASLLLLQQEAATAFTFMHDRGLFQQLLPDIYCALMQGPVQNQLLDCCSPHCTICWEKLVPTLQLEQIGCR